MSEAYTKIVILATKRAVEYAESLNVPKKQKKAIIEVFKKGYLRAVVDTFKK